MNFNRSSENFKRGFTGSVQKKGKRDFQVEKISAKRVLLQNNWKWSVFTKKERERGLRSLAAKHLREKETYGREKNPRRIKNEMRFSRSCVPCQERLMSEKIFGEIF